MTMTIHSNVSNDATLKLTLPDAFKNRSVKIVLETEDSGAPVDEPRDANGWPIGFFERTEGKWEGPLERGDQGEYEIRESF